jgi:hypothetical protein
MGHLAHLSALPGLARCPPGAQERCRVRERKLLFGGELVRLEPAELRDVVGGRRVSGNDPRRPAQIECGIALVAVPVGDDADELLGLDIEARFLSQLALERVARLLVLVHEATQEIPAPRRRLVRSPAEKDASSVVDDEAADGRRGLRIDDEPTRVAAHRAGFGAQVRRAARTVLPAVELAHARTVSRLAWLRPTMNP